MDYSLYFVTDWKTQKGRDTLWVVQEAIAGGVTVVQLRKKEGSTRLLVEESRKIRKITREAKVLFIVNDRLDVALACDADGVHLGEEDLPLPLARKIAPHLLIGYSCDTVEEAQKAEKLGASYLGVGSVYPTSTKPDAGEPIGLERLKAVVASVSIPVVAIGGIDLSRVEDVLKTGVAGVAVASAIGGASSPRAAAFSFRQKIRQVRGE